MWLSLALIFRYYQYSNIAWFILQYLFLKYKNYILFLILMCSNLQNLRHKKMALKIPVTLVFLESEIVTLIQNSVSGSNALKTQKGI